MELKPFQVAGAAAANGPLIVPYGIETYYKQKEIALVRVPLIVPYGIETVANNFCSGIPRNL